MRFHTFSPTAFALAAGLSLLIASIAHLIAPSRDLMALWLAAVEVASGHPQAIYPAPETLFTLRPALDWYDKAAAIGRAGPVYPYVYPPIWAFLLAPLTKLTSFSAFATAMLALNAMALLLLPQLAVQLALGRPAPRRLATLWAVGVFAAMLATHGMAIAYLQGQVQISVAFLTLLALERARNGTAETAGLALGLAIALKVSPLPVALIWLLCGKHRAGLVALGVAAAVGLASIGLAGWPLHRAFLAELGVINHTLLMSNAVASLDRIAGLCLDIGEIVPMTLLPESIAPGATSWSIAAKPALYGALQTAAMPCLVLAFGLALRRTLAPDRQAALWGAALTSLAFIGPIGWLYYYLAPLALVPVLWLRHGMRGLVVPVLALTMISLEKIITLPASLGVLGPMLGSLGICVLIAAFFYGVFKGGVENPGPPSQTRLHRAVT